MTRDVLQQAEKLESANDLPGARSRYLNATQLDPAATSAAEESIRRLDVRMKREADEALTRAKQYDAVGRIPEAVALYERAYQYLPEADPARKPVKDRLELLRVRP
jgi:tetratricopeptide (TPR) repeat protein